MRTFYGSNYTIQQMLIQQTYKMTGWQMIEQSDKQLVEAAQNGHLDSFAELYKRYYGCMAAVAYSVLGDRYLAEDAAQEAFAISCGDLARLKQPDKFAGWLAAICRNVARQMLRSKNKFVAIDDVTAAANKDAGEENGEAVRRAVWKLRTFDRELVTLRYYNGLSYEQIGGILGISSQAVNGRLIRAKRKIAKHLKNDGFTGGNHEDP